MTKILARKVGSRDVRWSKFVGTGKERNAFFPVSFPFPFFPVPFRAHLYCTPVLLSSPHQSTHVHSQHHYPGITPIAPSRYAKVLISVLATLPGITQPVLNEIERCKVLRNAGDLQNPSEGRFLTTNNSYIQNHTTQYTRTTHFSVYTFHISQFISFRISFVITTLCDLDGQLSSQRGFTFIDSCPR